jgi:RimJ/RimL family protein N-acetyltransferase
LRKLSLETKRLVLRPLRKGDEKTIHPFANDALVARFMLFDYPLSLKEEKRMVEKAIKNFGKGSFQFLAETKKSSEFAGWIQLRVEKKQKRGSIAVWVARKFWRKGFGEEIVKAIFDFGFNRLKLNRIAYNVFVGNKASESLIEKFGGKFEGVRREYFFKYKKFEDEKLFSILAREWKQKE